jgi:uncharacterized tellurite resistance protein B-like protein
MFDSIRALFTSALGELDSTAGQPGALNHQLATAALLLEMAHADRHANPAEQASIATALERAFSLERKQIDELIALAEAERDAAVCLHGFTRTLNESATLADRVRIVELLWKVAYADGNLDHYEEHLVRKIADLLHLKHGEYIGAKLAAAKAAGVEQ